MDAKSSGFMSGVIVADSSNSVASATPSIASVSTQLNRQSRWRDLVAFFIFGLVNNAIYVIFLSAAEEILKGSPNFPKSSVLLAEIIPGLVVKLISPYCIRIVPYQWMISACVAMNLASLLMVGLLKPVGLKFAGIMMASASSGLGESAFLALTSYYGTGVIVAWSSGTGAAGIVGSIYYLACFVLLKLRMNQIMLIAMTLPLMMACAYVYLLNPHYDVRRIEPRFPTSSLETSSSSSIESNSDTNKVKRKKLPRTSAAPVVVDTAVRSRMQQVRPLIWNYVLPLFLVYLIEYTINQSVFFSLYYPLEKTPFSHYDDTYKAYQAIYQIGVFVSRTFGRKLAVRNTWIFAFLQMGLLGILTIETIYGVIGNIYLVFGLVFIEGLLGGSAYVNTFCNISKSVLPEHREFSMAFAGLADCTGIMLAGVACIFLEPFLCARNFICTNRRTPVI